MVHLQGLRLSRELRARSVAGRTRHLEKFAYTAPLRVPKGKNKTDHTRWDCTSRDSILLANCARRSVAGRTRRLEESAYTAPLRVPKGKNKTDHTRWDCASRDSIRGANCAPWSPADLTAI